MFFLPGPQVGGHRISSASTTWVSSCHLRCHDIMLVGGMQCGCKCTNTHNNSYVAKAEAKISCALIFQSG